MVVVGDGIGILPQLCLGGSAIVVRRSIVGVKTQGLVVGGNGGGMLSQLRLGVPLLEIGDGGIPISLRTRPDDGKRRRVIRIGVARGNRLRFQEVAPEIRSGLRTLRDRKRQGALEDRLQGCLQIRGKGYVPPLQAVHGPGRRRSGDGVVDRGSQTEKIRIGSETGMRTVLFRRRILHGQDARMLHGPPRGEKARRTEVDQYGPTVREPDDVGGFDVAVQKIVPMHFLQGLAQVQGQMPRLVRGERPRFLQPGLQGGAVQVLHHDVGGAVFAEHVMDVHDMRGAETGDDSRFFQGVVLRAAKVFPVGSRHGDAGTGAHGAHDGRKQFLDGDGPPEFPVRALVRDAEAAFAQHASDGKLAVMQGAADRQAARGLRCARRAAAGTRPEPWRQGRLADGATIVSHGSP